jgi:hypothetical protein
VAVHPTSAASIAKAPIVFKVLTPNIQTPSNFVYSAIHCDTLGLSASA